MVMKNWRTGKIELKIANFCRPVFSQDPTLMSLWTVHFISTFFKLRELYEFSSRLDLRMSRKNTSAQGLMNFLSNNFLDRPKVRSKHRSKHRSITAFFIISNRVDPLAFTRKNEVIFSSRLIFDLTKNR